MTDFEEKIIFALRKAATQLYLSGFPIDKVNKFEMLADQVKDPCVVAVVGKVKVGKSSFINALLGQDCALVGIEETTATINYFRYSKSIHPLPIRCHFRNKTFKDVDLKFLNNLQGNDIKTMKLADDISHLEYFLQDTFLEEITLVDTPGMKAVVEEHHDRTAEFIRLKSHLQERHHQDTERIANQADAVIYLIEPVAKTSDREFLEEFSQINSGLSRAYNAIGIITKTDLIPNTITKPKKLAEKIARQLKEDLNLVIPISAGVHSLLERLLKDNQSLLIKLIEHLKCIPSKRLEMMFDSSEFFLEQEFSDCPITPNKRQQLFDSISGSYPLDWGVFSTVGQIILQCQFDIPQIIYNLREIAGFENLKTVLYQQFCKRGKLLRYYRIINDALKLISSLKFSFLPQLKQEQQNQEEKLQQFLRYIDQIKPENPNQKDLKIYIQGQLDNIKPLKQPENVIVNISKELAVLFHQVAEYNLDFEALQSFNNVKQVFSVEEREEIKALLTFFGTEIKNQIRIGLIDIDYIISRLLYWKDFKNKTPYGSSEQLIAERANIRYSLILNDLNESHNITLVVTGTTSSGKSSLVNLLCGAEIMPVGVLQTSAGVVVINHHPNKRTLKIPTVKGVPKEYSGEWSDLSDEQITRKLKDVMGCYNELLDKDPKLTTPRIELEYPTRLGMRPATIGLPRGFKLRIIDLPGLNYIADERSKSIIRRETKQALCLVTYNGEEVDPEKQQVLLNEVVENVKELQGSLPRMLFILNKIDVFRRDPDFEIETKNFINKTTQNIRNSIVKALPEYSKEIHQLQVHPLSTYAALWSYQALNNSQNITIKALGRIMSHFSHLIPEDIRDNLLLNITKWNNSQQQQVAENVWQTSYGANFDQILCHYIQNTISFRVT